MPHCAAFGCNFETKGKKTSDVSIHCFPSDKKRRAQWEQACGRTQLPKDPRLCSQHFSPDAFVSFRRPQLIKDLTGADGSRRRLKANAVPTIFAHKAPKRPRVASEKRGEKRERQATLDALLGRKQTTAAGSAAAEPVAGTSADTSVDTEEPDDSSFHVVLPSVSVQFASTTTDAASQTYVSTLDAAVQWPEDVHYPITMDHMYAGKQLETQQEEDCQSQDLFLSDDESSKEPQYTQSDPEYNSGPDEENCPGITFDVSEFTFPTDDENDGSNQEGVEVMKENNSSNEEGEEKEVIVDSDSCWENEDSDQLESDDSDEGHLNLRFELPKSLRQLCQHCGGFFFSCKTHTCKYLIKPFSCDTCGKRYLHERSLKIHRNIHKESYEHPCKFCLVAFKTRLAKLAHERAHKRSPRPYTCPDCPMSFVKLLKRNLHLKGHRGPKIFSCPHCALEFPSLYSLDTHIVVHTGMKLFVCNFCKRSFSQAGHLKSHLRVHTGEKPYQCQHCDKSFNHNVSLKSHITRYHTGPFEKMVPPGAMNEEMTTRDVDMDEDIIDGDPKRKEPMKKIRKTRKRSSGRPKGRPKRNAVMGETISITAEQGDALEPVTVSKRLEEGEDLMRSSSKDIESTCSDGDSTSELAEEDEAEESKAVKKSKQKASQRPNTLNIAEEDLDSDSDFDPAEEAKKRRTS